MLSWTAKFLSYLGRPVLRRERLEPSTIKADNAAYGMETRNRTLASPAAGSANPDSSSESAEESCVQDGVRGRATESAHAGAGTRQPYSATHYLTTTFGITSYAELAPHLATSVQTLQSAIISGEFDDHALDERLLIEFHQRMCADLTPQLAGRWRTNELVVGGYEPPAFLLVPQKMREYALDLQSRRASLSQHPNFLMLKTFAFAEGMRCSASTPFASLAAGGNDSQALMDIWRRGIEEAVP